MLPLTVTYNRLPPNIKPIILFHLSILKTNKALEKTFTVELILAFRKTKSPNQLIGGNTIDKNIKKLGNKYEANVHLVNLKYGHCVVYKCKTHIHFVANKIGRYLQRSTKSTAKATLPSIFENARYVGKVQTDSI